MPNRGKRRNGMRRGRKGARGAAREISEAATQYSGPATLGRAVRGIDLHTLDLHYEMPFGSDVSGNIIQVFSNNPSGGSNWTAISGTFEGYRTLAMRLSYTPANRYTRGTVATYPIVTTIDYEDLANLGSYAQAAYSSSFRSHTLDDPFSVTARMFGVESAGFVPTSTPVNTFVIKCYANNLSISTLYGLLIIDYRVQFRGLGI